MIIYTFVICLCVRLTTSTIISWRDLLVPIDNNTNANTSVDQICEPVEYQHLSNTIMQHAIRDKRVLSANFTNAKQIASQLQPLIFPIESSPAKDWQAREWSVNSVSQPELDVLPNVGYSNKSLHKFSEETRLLSPILPNWKKHTQHDTTRGNLFSTCNDTFYHYLSGKLYPSGFGTIWPFKDFIVPLLNETDNTFIDKADDDLKQISVGLFMGCAGVRTHLHYDVAHNFFFQLAGRKRFVLFPPHFTSDFYTLPSVHPEFRQSAIEDIEKIDLNKYPRLNNVKGTGRVVVLEAGDALYIPPNWLHYVTAIDDSISIQFFTIASMKNNYAVDLNFTLQDQLKEIPLPFEEYWDEKEFGEYFYQFLCMLFDAFRKDTLADKLVKRWYETRWAAVMEQFNDHELHESFSPISDRLCCKQQLLIENEIKPKFKSRINVILQHVTSSKKGLHEFVLFDYLDTVLSFMFDKYQLINFVFGIGYDCRL